MRDINLPVLFLNLLRSKVKWKLFYDAKTVFVSALKVWRGIFFKHNYRQACHTTLSNSIERLGSMSSVMEHNRTKNLLESPIKFDFRTQSNQSN